MTQPPNPGDHPQGRPGGYQPPQQGGYQPPQPPQQGGYQPPQRPQQGGYQPPQQPQQGGYQPPQQPGPDFSKQQQQGGYQQPQQGYQPPAPGGYQPTGQPGYPQQPAGPANFNVGDAFSWAWNKFTKNALALILGILGWFVIIGIVLGITYALAIGLGTTTDSVSSSYGGSYSYSYEVSSVNALFWVIYVLGYLVALVLGGVAASAVINGVLKIADGQQVDVGSFYKPRNAAQVIIATILVGIGVGIGSIVIIGGIIVGLFCFYASWAVVDRDLPAIEGIKTSFNLVKDNFVTVIITYLLAGIIATVGFFLCGIGALVTVPVALLFTAYSWRTVSHGQIAPITQ